MQVGRFTVLVEPFFVVMTLVVAALGLVAPDGPLRFWAPVAATLLLARTLGAFAAGLLVLLGNDGWARVTIGLFQTPTGAAVHPWARRLEPLVGLLGAFVGVAAVYLAAAGLETVAPTWSATLRFGATVGFWVLVVWCLPMLPFDGGQVVRELLPGLPRRRAQLAAGLSVVTGLLLVAYFVLADSLLTAAAIGVLVVGNLLRATGRTSFRPGAHVCSHSCDVVGSLYLAGPDAALRTHLLRARETDPVLALVVENWGALGDPAVSARVQDAYGGREADETSRGAYLLWCTRTGRWDQVTALVVDPRAVSVAAMVVAVKEASDLGADQQVVLLAERVLHGTACNACVPMSSTTLHSSRSRIRLGDVDRAVADLARCRLWTTADLRSLYSHPDLDPVRRHPAWPNVQAALPPLT